MLVERELNRTEGKSRHDIGREAFLEKVWEWKNKHAGRIEDQMKQMGFSLDWERQRFTMDDGASAAVREDFVRLHEQGLIYRANRLVNWCSDCQTAVSDLEVNNIDEQGSLWELKYEVAGEPGRFVVVATTRPETMLGDTGVAVHPDDERYTDLIGKTLKLPLCDREIPVVADTFVDPEFGSGAVKVTPAHDFNDFDCGQRCGLESRSIIDREGKLCGDIPAKYIGMHVDEARKVVVADLAASGNLGEIEDYKVPRGRCGPFQHRNRANAQRAVVGEHGTTGKARHRSCGGWSHQVRSRALVQDVHALDEEHQTLVHLAPALVGPSHSGLVLRRMRRRHRRARDAYRVQVRFRQAAPGHRRSRYLV